MNHAADPVRGREGLVVGIWIPVLGLRTTGCLVLYFVVAIRMYIRARNFGRSLVVNALRDAGEYADSRLTRHTDS